MTNHQLPPTPSLEFDKKQAKALLKAYQQGDTAALDRIHDHHPRLRHKSHEEILAADFKLADAQWVIAREYGFSSWTKLKRHIQSLSTDFKDKVVVFKDAVQSGDFVKVRKLLEKNPDLRLILDEPLFGFDSQAVVISSSRQNISMVKVLLEYGADINVKSEWWAGGFSALDGANEDTAKFLIERGARVDIHAACKFDMVDRVIELIAANPDLVNAKGGDGQRPLHFAKSKRIMDYLLTHGADINARDVDHYGTAAQWAINDLDKCRYLVDKGAVVDIFIAIALGDAELVKQVLAENPDAIHARIGEGDFEAVGSDGGHIYVYELGYTVRPLNFAGQKGDQTIINVLLEHASPQQRFLYACSQADEALAMGILRENPAMVISLPKEDQQLISDVTWEHKTEAVRLMLKLGFDVDTTGIHYSTALDRAATRGYIDLVELLIKHGASITIKNEFDGTPLGAAVWGAVHFCDPDGDYPATVEALVKAGASVHADWLPTGNNAIDDILRRYVNEQST